MRRLIALTAFLASAALMLAAATPAYADPGGNGNGKGNGNGTGTSGAPNGANGTVKVHDFPDHKNGSDMANDPKVCRFEIHGFKFDAGQTGTWWIQEHKWGNGDKSKAVLSGSYAADGAGDWTRGPYTLDDGHYKLFVEVKHRTGNGNTVTTHKHKVFKVKCAQDAAPEEEEEEEQEEQDQVVLGQEVRADSICVEGMLVTRLFVNESLQSVTSTGRSCAELGVEQPPVAGVAPIEAPAAPAQVAGQLAAPITALPSTSTASTPLVLSAFLAGLGAWILRRR